MGIIENAKEIATLVKTLGSIDLQQKIVDLQGDILDLTTKNQELERENRELRETLSLKGKMKWEKPVYRTEGEEDPYCPQCWEVSQKQVHLKKWQYEEWFCHNCDKMCATSTVIFLQEGGAQLGKRWREALQRRPAGGGVKRPQAAWVESPSGER